MQRQGLFKVSYITIIFPLFFTLFLWVIFWFEIRFGFDFTRFGIYPRTVKGLRGILLGPFIHGGLQHLYNNTFPLLILLMMLFYFYAKLRWKVIGYGLLLSGLLTWIFARDAYHIGASGFIYILVSFIFFKGIFTRYYRLTALSLLIIFLYGGLLWYVFPIDDTISWEGHLSGGITGLFMAVFLKHHVPVCEESSSENTDIDDEDPFLKHFDDDGNFIPEHELIKREQTMEKSGLQKKTDHRTG